MWLPLRSADGRLIGTDFGGFLTHYYPRNPDLHRGCHNRQVCRHRGTTARRRSEIYLRAGGEKRSSLLLSDLQS